MANNPKKIQIAADKLAGRVPTGEWGFCERCGQVAAVVVTAEDRMRNRLVRASLAKAERDKRQKLAPVQALRLAISDAMVHIAVAKGLANYGLVEDDPRRLSRSATMEVRRDLQETMRSLILSEAHLAAWLGEPVDLLREATEELERQTDTREPGAEEK